MFHRPLQGDDMPIALELTGQKFTRLTVGEKVGKTNGGQWRYKCTCDCGKETVVATGWLRSGHSKSCGCLSADMARTRMLKHGRSKQPDYERAGHVRRKYGVTPEQYNELLDKQSGKCVICGYAFGQRKGDIQVDHCHDSGKVRGLLCDKCNRGLGFFQDQKQLLENAAAYLAR